MITISVVLYVAPGCPYCQMGREFLASRGVAFTELDVTRNSRALCDMLYQFGRPDVPALLAGYKGAIGFDAEAWREVLDHAEEISRSGDPLALPTSLGPDPIKL